jgi:GH43 family beta-xylosidase
MNYSTDLWAPELHQIDQQWFVIFTADPSSDSPSPSLDALCDFNCPAVRHRMFVLESNSSELWTTTFSVKSQLDTYDQFAIDGTYFQHAASMYHVYSCWFGQYVSWPANLCIAKSMNSERMTGMTAQSTDHDK